MKRCFIALALPDATSDALHQAQNDLAPLLDADTSPRWVTIPNLHLTLKFLGQVPDERFAPLQATLARVAAAGRVLHVELAGLGLFGGARPRSIYAAVGRGKAEVLALMAAVDAAVSTLGFVAEQVPRVPHVTLARLRKGAPVSSSDPSSSAPSALHGRLAQHKPVAYGPVDGATIVLYESVSDTDGVRYTPLARWPLGNSPG